MLAFGDLINFANMKSLHIECKEDPELCKLQEASTSSDTSSVVDAFNVLMSGAKCYPSKKQRYATCMLVKWELYLTAFRPMKFIQ